MFNTCLSLDIDTTSIIFSKKDADVYLGSLVHTLLLSDSTDTSYFFSELSASSLVLPSHVTHNMYLHEEFAVLYTNVFVFFILTYEYTVTFIAILLTNGALSHRSILNWHDSSGLHTPFQWIFPVFRTILGLSWHFVSETVISPSG